MARKGIRTMTLNLTNEDMIPVWQRAKEFVSGDDQISESGVIWRMANFIDRIATGQAVVMEMDDEARELWKTAKKRFGSDFSDSGILNKLVQGAAWEYKEGRTNRMQTERIEQKTDIEIWLLFELLDRVLDNETVERLKVSMQEKLENRLIAGPMR